MAVVLLFYYSNRKITNKDVGIRNWAVIVKKLTIVFEEICKSLELCVNFIDLCRSVWETWVPWTLKNEADDTLILRTYLLQYQCVFVHEWN